MRSPLRPKDAALLSMSVRRRSPDPDCRSTIPLALLQLITLEACHIEPGLRHHLQKLRLTGIHAINKAAPLPKS